MFLSFQIITGVMAGFEFVEDGEAKISWLVLDLLIFRVMIGK